MSSCFFASSSTGYVNAGSGSLSANDSLAATRSTLDCWTAGATAGDDEGGGGGNGND
jgi:hypothetical protein